MTGVDLQGLLVMLHRFIKGAKLAITVAEHGVGAGFGSGRAAKARTCINAKPRTNAMTANSDFTYADLLCSWTIARDMKSSSLCFLSIVQTISIEFFFPHT